MNTITQSLLAILTAVAVLQVPGIARAADTLEDAIKELEREWAVAKYEVPKAEQKERFTALSVRAHEVSRRFAGHPEPLVWEAIILSSEADAGGGLHALKAVKEARGLLLAAESMNPTALDGSVYTTLGSLYYQVPGWPISFGSDRKARAYLEKALELNPGGIDPNYFYGEFLIKQGEYQKAVAVLQAALVAEPRPDRPIADAGRRKEIEEALSKARAKL